MIKYDESNNYIKCSKFFLNCYNIFLKENPYRLGVLNR